MDKKTVLTRKELSERWDVDPRTIDKFEQDGIIQKNRIGTRKDHERKELKAQILEYRTIIDKVKVLTNI